MSLTRIVIFNNEKNACVISGKVAIELYKPYTARAPASLGLVAQLGKRVELEEVRRDRHGTVLSEMEKRKYGMNLPNNSSVSVTLDYMAWDPKTNAYVPFSTTTSVMFVPAVLPSGRRSENAIYLNNERQYPSAEEKHGGVIGSMLTVADKIMRLAGVDHRKAALLVVSENTLPTAAGLSSSASGGAAFVHALVAAVNYDFGELRESEFAREVSGSAARVKDGFNFWFRGRARDGNDSYASSIMPATHWPELKDVIVVVDVNGKEISSREAHERSVRSPLYEKRIRFAEKNARNLIRVIRAKNFEGLGHITMADSDNVHEVLKSVGINYLTRESEEVKSAISELNRREMKLVAAYSFSLGPNLHVLTTAERLDMVLEAIGKIGAVKDLMVLSPGNGPELLDEKASLIDAANLAPLMRKQAG